MAGATIQNASEPTFYSTMSFEDYFANSTEDLSETTITDQKSRSVNIHGILWPILFTVLIIVANFLSLVAFCIEKRLRTYNNYFIINLTILDFITGLFLILTVVHTHIGYYPFSQDICKVTSTVQYGILNASNLAVVVICADRHQATYDPINHFISRSKRMAVIKNLIPWTVSVVFWFLFTIIPELIIDFDNGRQCVRWYTLQTIPGIIPFITEFYLPFTIIAVLYFRIVAKIQATLGGKNVEKQFAMKDANKGKITAELPQQMKNDNAANNAKNTTIKRETPTEMRKATRTLLFIVIAFVVSWLPLSITMIIFSIKPVLVIPGLPRPALLFIGWMSYLNSLLNPISYAVSQPLFRSTIINMFLCRRRK